MAEQGQELSTEQILEAQFNKVGKLVFQVEVMSMQINALQKENADLKKILDEAEKSKG